MSLNNQHPASRTTRFPFRTTAQIMKDIKKNWDSEDYTNEQARLIPHPHNSLRMLNFTSQNEFFEFVLKTVCKMNIVEWNEFVKVGMRK